MQQNNNSEVALLVQQIQDEYHSAKMAMEGPVCVGSHEFITARMERMCGAMDQLQKIVGSDAVAHLWISLF